MRKYLLAGVAAAALLAATGGTMSQDSVKQGGTMTVTYQNDVSTLDPAIGYDWQNWSIIKSIFDGLMDYEPGTTNLVPDLAESYAISDDGLTYTFKLRPGVKFHNGREMTAEDVKYSLDRVTTPATQSPGAGFFGSIEGFAAMADGSATSLSGVTVVDPQTVAIKLTRPDATFLHVMAINFSFVVPKEAVEEFGADFGRNPAGTGAFKLGEWTLGQRLVLVRNPDHWKAGVPKLDQITFEIGIEPTVALLRLQNGEVDILGDGIPPAQFLQVKDDPKWSPLIIEGGQLHTGYLTMNVNTAPLDKADVRKAINMAINKQRIVQIINNRALPANQPLPPSMPGYAKDYEGYPYDPEGAKALLASAGTSSFSTDLYVYNTDPNPRIAQAIQQDLAAIGITANIQSLAQANVIEAGGNGSAPMIWSGGMAWIADFPDPSNFYGPILSCAGAAEGGWNWSKYCNETLDAKGVEADSIVDPAKATEREQKWREVYLGVMEDAPWVPIFNEQRFTMRAERLGGPDSYFVDPVHIPVAYDYVYAKDVQ